MGELATEVRVVCRGAYVTVLLEFYRISVPGNLAVADTGLY